MNNKHLLDCLGIQQWYPRKLKHAWYHKSKVIVDISPAILQVKCLVLLPLRKDQNKSCAPEVNKILTGMLGVLNLAATELSIARIYTADLNLSMQDWQQVFLEVACWQPKFILQLDKMVSICNEEKILVRTYHPEHLVKNPHDKAATHKDLLTLKDKLHNHDHRP